LRPWLEDEAEELERRHAQTASSGRPHPRRRRAIEPLSASQTMLAAVGEAPP
jgi:hypothetical protein